MEENIHALVGYGHHGKHERIQNLRCQTCGKKFTVRRDTVRYRLKSHSEKVALGLALLAEGMDVSALERVTGIKEGTLRTWLTRAGMHADKLHARFFQELIYGHIQPDELWANFDHKGREMWLWVATEASSKLIPGDRDGSAYSGYGDGSGACSGLHNETWLSAYFHHGWLEVIFLCSNGSFWALGKE
jgi:hypothetical protein